MTPSTTDSLALAATIARRPPATEFVYEAVVDIGERVSIGQAPLGERFIVPIIGGVFKGADIEGVVLPGGADRQLVRRDGVRELDALYELQTHDGVVLTVHNRVLIDDPAGGPRYALSHISITAPQGSYDWLNRRTYVGTLDALLDLAVAQCRSSQVDAVFITVRPSNVPAATLYKNSGFVWAGYEDQYFGVGEPRDLLVHRIVPEWPSADPTDRRWSKDRGPVDEG